METSTSISAPKNDNQAPEEGRFSSIQKELVGLTNENEPTIGCGQDLTQINNVSDDTQDVDLAQNPHEHSSKGPQVQETDIERIQRVFGELDLELPDWLVEVMAKKFDGMMPMERFFAENCEAMAELQGMQSENLVLDCGATYASSMEGKNVDDGMKPDQRND